MEENLAYKITLKSKKIISIFFENINEVKECNYNDIIISGNFLFSANVDNSVIEIFPLGGLISITESENDYYIKECKL